MDKTKVVIFDIYNTLLDNETDEQRQDTYRFLSLWLSYHDIQIKPADLRTLYLNLCHKEISRSTENYPDIEIGKVFFEILASRGNQPPSETLVSEMALLFRILTTNHLAPFPGVIDLLTELRDKVRVGVASNAQRLFTIPELTRFGMTGYFDAMIFSSDIGASKPNRKIFTAALEALSAEPETTLYVGDSLLADIFGAKSVGMKTLWINRGRHEEDVTLVRPDFEARNDTSMRAILLGVI